MNKKGTLAILIGPSGSGKGTLIHQLLQDDQETFLSVSATTRAPRPGETDKVNYYFITKEEFEQMIADNALLEYACYCENYYGTPKAPVFERLDRGEHVLLEIEMQGAKQVKAQYPDAVSIFIMPPSMEELRRRLTGRGTETAEVIEKRLAAAVGEMEYAKECDRVVVNDDVVRAAREIAEILDNCTKA